MGKGKTGPAVKRGNAVGNVFRTIGVTFKEGDWKTRISYIILGFGELLRGQWLKGIALMLCEVGFIA